MNDIKNLKDEFKIKGWMLPPPSGAIWSTYSVIEEYQAWCTSSFGLNNYAIYWDEPFDTGNGYRCDFKHEEYLTAFRLKFGL